MTNHDLDLRQFPVVNGRLVCTAKLPKPPETRSQMRWAHPDAVEVADYGETRRMQCPHCKTAWTEELPQ